MNKDRVTIVGAGLAGCEAAWQLVRRGVPVRLIDMKPTKFSPAHRSEGFAELVCSNSLKAEHLTNASGLLKAEMRALNGLILASAEKCRVPAGGALAVDRHRFSETITETLKNHPLVEFESAVIDRIPDGPCIIATGPLTDPALTDAISQLPGAKALHFFDAAAPIVTAESLDMDKVFRASRYDKGSDYLNCPMNEDEYNAFYDALMGAELAELHNFEKKLVFEGCLAVEILASRGRQTLAFGPLKPVGLKDPRTGKEPYAVVQLRQDNAAGSVFNLVGFQTHLKFGEQKRVFSMIPALKNAEFVRYGVMHQNTFLQSPRLLDKYYADRRNPLVAFAGQMTGVEGYVESTASGYLAAVAMAAKVQGRQLPEFPKTTAIGALGLYISDESVENFQPMNINFSIIAPLEQRIRKKAEKNLAISQRALAVIDALRESGI